MSNEEISQGNSMRTVRVRFVGDEVAVEGGGRGAGCGEGRGRGHGGIHSFPSDVV